MGSIPRDYDRQCQFDAFCKSVLRNEARNFQRSMRRQRRRVTPLEAVPLTKWDKLSTLDSYPICADIPIFKSHRETRIQEIISRKGFDFVAIRLFQ